MVQRQILAVLLLSATVSALPAQTASTPRARAVASDVAWLAADEREGRMTCERGGEEAARWLAEQFRRIGLRAAGDSGSFFQRWTTPSTTGARQAQAAGCATQNVAGLVPGSGALAGQIVIVGAHYDHVGRGRFASRDSAPGQVHNGADDNASGTAAVLELARVVTRARRGSQADARAVLFVLFSAEEIGAIGSAYFAEHSPVPLDSVMAYLNFDMVGRLRDGRLLVLGARTATEWPELLETANAGVRLDLRASGDGWGPSDHASFYARRLPVLHFFTDLHEDYHSSRDDAAAINTDGIVQVVDLAAALVNQLAVRPARLTFVDVPRPQPAVAAAGRGRPSLGTIPDMTDEPGGVRLTGVRAGSVADSAGLRAGDILIGLGEHAIANLQDFQNALTAHAPGDRVEVRFRRGDQLMRVTVVLGGTRPQD